MAQRYRALPADRAAERRALRPKRTKVARCSRLRRAIESKLEDNWSPQQISSWLADVHPHDPEMQVSHETIYQSLFVQGKGALRKELHTCLRSGRAMRRAKAYTKANHIGQGKLKNMVMISQRPAEVAHRAVPGHWEGDLIFGKKMTAIATLVERQSRYVMLCKLPNGHGAEAVRIALAKRDLDSACHTPAVADMGPGQGDGRARALQCGDRCGGLLLRPQESLATWHQREHQWPVAPVPPKERRPVAVLTAAAQCRRTLPQPTPSTDAGLDDTISGVRRGVALTP